MQIIGVKRVKRFFRDVVLGIAAGAVAVSVVFLIAVVVGFPLMLLWNWLIPEIFGLSQINFYQACGLYALCGILFKTSRFKDDEDGDQGDD